MTDEERLDDLQRMYSNALYIRDWLSCNILADEIEDLEKSIEAACTQKQEEQK